MKQRLKRRRQRNKDSDNVKGRIESFWTVCPYCYYIFEYEIVYLDCCLRCQNCKKAFHAVAINGPLPEVTVVDGEEQYKVSLALFKICYSYEAAAVVDDEEKGIGMESKTAVGCKTEDLIDIDAGSNNIQRRRVIANHEDTSGYLNVKEFCEKLQEKMGTREEDDRSKQEIKQSQSRTGGELSDVQMVGTGKKFRSEIENTHRLVADRLENGLIGESGELDFYMNDDDIYVGLADL